MAPTVDYMTDERLSQLLDGLRGREGFANNVIWADELRTALVELSRLRDRPLHCPGCEGDHL